MNKQEKLIVGALFAFLLFWMIQQHKSANQRMAESRAAETNQVMRALAPEAADTAAYEPQKAEAETELSEVDKVSSVPEVTVEIGNEKSRLLLTSKGGGIRSVALLEYPSHLNAEDGSVVELTYSNSAALLLGNLPGFGRGADFDIKVSEDGCSAELRAKREDGLELVRRLDFSDSYRLSVNERFVNSGTEAIALPEHDITLGAMETLPGEDDNRGTVAAEFRRVATKKPEYLEAGAARLARLFGGSAGGGCSRGSIPGGAPLIADMSLEGPLTWGAVRSRFFVQILTPAEAVSSARVRVKRAEEPTGVFSIAEIGAALRMEGCTLEPGASRERNLEYYAGPRKLSLLRTLGDDQSRLMRFGTWRIFCEGLLDLLNFLYRFVPNYGVAIIILTLLVRLVMLPVSRRGTESMKRMQALQPKMKELQTQYKDDPQKLQRETMLLYREHKVNPLSSCLPMLIQLPIFIALFTVLRSAVELRFAPFLWVVDLSAPENLFRETLGFGINILPVAMAGTMALQSYLTPTAGDPSQQRMMMVMMPIMMLVMFYRFPAALGLYWSTSQLLAILALLWQRRKAASSVVSTGEVEVITPPKETRQMRRARER